MGLLAKVRSAMTDIVNDERRDVLVVEFKPDDVPHIEDVLSYFDAMTGLNRLYFFTPSLERAGRGSYYKIDRSQEGHILPLESRHDRDNVQTEVAEKPLVDLRGEPTEEGRRALWRVLLPQRYAAEFGTEKPAADTVYSPVLDGVPTVPHPSLKGTPTSEPLGAPSGDKKSKTAKKEKKLRAVENAMAGSSTGSHHANSSDDASVAWLQDEVSSPEKAPGLDDINTQMELAGEEQEAPSTIPSEVPALSKKDAKKLRKKERKAARKKAKAHPLILDLDTKAYSPSVPLIGLEPTESMGVDEEPTHGVTTPPEEPTRVEPYDALAGSGIQDENTTITLTRSEKKKKKRKGLDVAADQPVEEPATIPIEGEPKRKKKKHREQV